MVISRIEIASFVKEFRKMREKQGKWEYIPETMVMYGIYCSSYKKTKPTARNAEWEDTDNMKR